MEHLVQFIHLPHESFEGQFPAGNRDFPDRDKIMQTVDNFVTEVHGEYGGVKLAYSFVRPVWGTKYIDSTRSVFIYPLDEDVVNYDFRKGNFLCNFYGDPKYIRNSYLDAGSYWLFFHRNPVMFRDSYEFIWREIWPKKYGGYANAGRWESVLEDHWMDLDFEE